MTGSVIKLILRRYLIAGLLVWLPIIATVLVVRFILDLMDQLLPHPLRPEALLGVHIPGLGALLALLLLLATGLLVTNIIGRTLVRAWEDVLNRIPFVRAVYGGVKSFSTTILSNSGNSFKKVLLIEYPRAGLWSVGFQTAADVRLSPAQGSEPQRVRVHSDHAQPDLRIHRHGAALAGHRTGHERRCGDEDDRDAGRGRAGRAAAHRQADSPCVVTTADRSMSSCWRRVSASRAGCIGGAITAA